MNKTFSPRHYLTRTIRRTASTLNAASAPEGATGPQVRALYHRWAAACSEAMDLIQLESRGCGRGASQCSCRDIGDVLEVDKVSRQALREFVEQYPEERAEIEDGLRFRQMVITAVGQLRQQGVAA
jgi:hypothetical protein